MPFGFAPRFRRGPVTAPPPRPSLTLFFWLTGAFVLTLLPQIGELTLWLSVVIVIALAVRVVMEIKLLPLPSTLFTFLLALCLLPPIYLQFHNFFGREAGTAFMAGLLTIKFYELRGPRDVSVIVFASIFIVMSALLYSQALELFLYCLIMMWLLTAILIRNNLGDRPEHHLLLMLRLAGVVFLQALPLTLFLFFFFPRYHGKFQLTLNDAPLGISDTVAPGSVARLANNDALAMYVRFTSGVTPAPETMYWRGLVLWDYRHGVWKPGSSVTASGAVPTKENGSTVVQEQITILPHNQRWLFALDYPVSAAANVSATGLWGKSQVLRGDILQLALTDGVVDHTERYNVTSASQLASLHQLPPGERIDGTRLPGDEAPDAIDPRVRALADGLFRANPQPAAYAGAVLRYFHQEGFTYTISPGNIPAGGDWLSYFLFTSKKGYCEHFASAFAVLMRLEDIPARLVVGYQGARYNPYDDVYTVLQSDAHAWDEVWIETNGQGRWMRIDPTAALPPGMTNYASSSSGLPEEDQNLKAAPRPLSLSDTYLPAWASHSLRDFEMRRQQIEIGWDDWVFSYNPETQTQLAQVFGFGPQDLGLLCAAAVLLCFFIFRQFMRRREVVSPVESLYSHFCHRMAQRGIPRAKWEGPLAYTERVAEAFPEKREAIHHVGAIVASSRYGPHPGEPAAPRELQALLAQISASQAASVSE